MNAQDGLRSRIVSLIQAQTQRSTGWHRAERLGHRHTSHLAAGCLCTRGRGPAASQMMLSADLGSWRRRRCALGRSTPSEAAFFVSTPWWEEAESRLGMTRKASAPDISEPSGQPGKPRVLALARRRRFHFGKRPYLADRKPPFQHFYPDKLLITCLRGCMIAAIQPMHVALMQITDTLNQAEDDDDDDDDKIVWPNWRELFRGYPYSAGAVIFRNLSVSSLMRGLEAIAVRTMNPRLASKVVKDVVLSAERKAVRLGNQGAAWAMLKTSAYASVILNLANLIYDLLQLGYELFVDKYPRYRIGPPPPPDAPQTPSPDVPRKPLSRRVTRILIVNLASYTIGTCGMAVGTLVYPGQGTTIGGLVADLAQLVV